MIAGRLTNAGAVADHLAALAPKADAALRDAAGVLLDRLRDRVDRNLSGEVLNARSGALRASLAGRVDSSSRIAAMLGTDLPYAAFQEYGFTGSESVLAHLRQQSQAFGRPIRPVQAAVRAFGRRVDYPAHSYLRSALAELTPDIRGGIATAVSQAIGS